MSSLIRDDAKPGHLSAGACRGVDCHHGHHRLGALVHTLHLTDVPTIRGSQSNGLGAIMWRATTKGNDEVTVLLLDLLEAGLYLSTCGIRFTTIIDRICDARLIQRISESLHSPHLHQYSICDDQRLLVPQGFDLTHGSFHGTLTHDGLARHEEGLPFIPWCWVVIVQSMGALSGVSGQILGQGFRQVKAGIVALHENWLEEPV
mmetsp:Transcript_640/g.1357  ORF Transcript_640/g.1357 Transcript_640/m.1357 type:complete len:204 (-) Transcript_640:12-623(-)